MPNVLANQVAALVVLLNCDDQGKAGELPAFAWPGGYAMFYITTGGDELCDDCATADLLEYIADGECCNDDPPVAYGAYGATDDYPTDYDARCDNCNRVIAERMPA